MPAPAPTRYTIVAAALFDGSGGPATADVALTVESGRILSIERRGPRWSPPAHEVLDLSGCTIAPGLIDSHCHLALQPELEAEASIAFAQDASESEIVSTMRRNAGRALSSGVTTVRDCGSPRGTGVLFRSESDAAADALPRVLVSGRPITTTRGHCHWMGLVADSVAGLVSAVAALADEGVDFIKVMATGGMMTSTSNPYAAQYTASELTQLVLEARRRGKPVAAHALSADGVRAAIAAGVNTLEHCTTTTAARQDYDPALNAGIVASGIIVGVTAHHPLRELLRRGDVRAIRDRLAPHREIREAGALMTVHSDAGTPGTAFDALAESIQIFQIGLDTTIEEALQAATSTAARALGIESETGLLAAGRAADIVVLDGDLRSDIGALAHVVAVVRAGAVLYPQEGRTNSGAPIRKEAM
jgi:imidazolonepropionase-like amidohydrolase